MTNVLTAQCPSKLRVEACGRRKSDFEGDRVGCLYTRKGARPLLTTVEWGAEEKKARNKPEDREIRAFPRTYSVLEPRMLGLEVRPAGRGGQFACCRQRLADEFWQLERAAWYDKDPPVDGVLPMRHSVAHPITRENKDRIPSFTESSCASSHGV